MTIRRLSTLDLGYVAAAFAAALVWLSMLAWYSHDGMPYDHTSGVWAALAQDAAKGLLYRPLHSELGYGGTRYMPLAIVVQGVLMRAGLGAAAAGVWFTLASFLIYFSGLYVVLRRFGATGIHAASAVVLPVGTISVQLISIAIRSDLFAAGMLLWGLRAAMDKRALAAAVLWSLAFAAKMSAPWAPVIFAIASIAAGERKAGVRLLGLTATLCLAVAVLAYVASDGRMLASFAAAADGGASLRYALLAPWWVLFAARQDPFFIALTVIAIALTARRVWRTGWDVLSIWFIGALLATLTIFATPGADTNHFPDLIAAAVMMIVMEARLREALAICVLFVSAQLAQLVPHVPSVRHFLMAHGRPTVTAVQRIERRLGAGETGPILSENPLIPIMWGQRPEVSDPFNLRLIAQRDPKVREEVFNKIAQRYYRAVVLMDWNGELRADMGRTTGRIRTSSLNFPDGFYPAVRASYRVTLVEPPIIVMEPR